jgi:NAD(P)-dependent dehydrogenase (short-subunit alcohol dehydrogenase family)
MVARSRRVARSRALVAGATLGAGRGIAAALGEAGATVVCMGSHDRNRWNQRSVDSGQLTSEYGFTDIDGSQPDIWRYIEEISEPGLHANTDDYR